MLTLNRRRFLTVAGGSAAATTVFLPGNAFGRANEKLRLGIVGTGPWGTRLARDFLQIDDCEVVSACDIDSVRVEKLAADLLESGGKKVNIVTDVRKMLDDRSIDAIVVATPTHWNALVTIWACQAGKDVYLGSPILAHNVFESRQVVEAAAKYHRVVQCGLYKRGNSSYERIVATIKEGAIGRVSLVRVWMLPSLAPLRNKENSEAPRHVDYNLWLGPAQTKPFNPNRFHSTWQWFWDYGAGTLGDHAADYLDLAVWALNLSGPVGAISSGEKQFADARETPDTMGVAYEFPNVTVIWEHRPRVRGDEPVGMEFYGTEGRKLRIGPSSWNVLQIQERREQGYHVEQLSQPLRVVNSRDHVREHLRSFVDSVKSRESLVASAAEAHTGTTLSHLGNIAWRTGHALQFDPKVERFINNGEANALLRREYRQGFTVPDRV